MEFEVVGGLMENLSTIASYTTMKLRDTVGRRLRNIPDRTLAVLLNYRFTQMGLKNLNVLAGVYRVGNTAGDTPAAPATALGVIEQTSFFVAERVVYNAGASSTSKASASFSMSTICSTKNTCGSRRVASPSVLIRASTIG